MKTLTAFFTNTEDARKSIEDLKNEGAKNVSYERSKENMHNFVKTEGTAAKDALEGASIGALAGLAMSALMVPGLGAALAVGVVLMLLAQGAVTGAVVGALAGWGVGADKARYYEQKIKKGEAMVAADITGADEEDVVETLKNDHAKEVAIHEI